MRLCRLKLRLQINRLRAPFKFKCLSLALQPKNRWKCSADREENFNPKSGMLKSTDSRLTSPFWPSFRNSIRTLQISVKNWLSRTIELLGISSFAIEEAVLWLDEAILSLSIFTHRLFVLAIVHRRLLTTVGINILSVGRKIVKTLVETFDWWSIYLHVDMNNACRSPLRTPSSLNHRLSCLAASIVVLLIIFCGIYFFN